MKIGDILTYTFEDGEEIVYEVCTFEALLDYLEHARRREVNIRSFDDPMRRVVGWVPEDAPGRALTLIELKEKRATDGPDSWFWERVGTVRGRAEIAERYSVRGS